MELLFQVLLQFGDSRKVVEITEQSKDEVISKLKRLFDINTSNELLLQEYEDEWQEWVDVEDVHRIKDKAKLRVLVQRDRAAFKEKHAVSFFLCQINIFKFMEYIYF